MIVVGIDWSMTSPAICVHAGEVWSLDNCTFYIRTDKKRMVESCSLTNQKINATLIGKYLNNEQRFAEAAVWAGNCLDKHITAHGCHEISLVCLEGYAMGASGISFQIGESTGVLKQELWARRFDVITPAPTVIKKFASGKGNAQKDVLESKFIQETGVNIRVFMGNVQTAKSWNPSSDIIDSYFLCHYAWEQCVSDKK